MPYLRQNWNVYDSVVLKRQRRRTNSVKGRGDDWAARSLFGRGRKIALATTALAMTLLAGTAEHAGATVWSNFTNAGFITLLPGNDALTFTFDGKNAAYTDNLNIVLSGGIEHFIVNNNAIPGSTLTVTGLSPGQAYNLDLTDTVTGEHWSSDPAKDGTAAAGVTYTSDLIKDHGDVCSHGSSCAQAPHLAFTTLWSSFGLGGSAPGAPGSIYYGWEDLPLAGQVADANVSGGTVAQITTGEAAGDYNDLVFQITQSASPARVSEPASLALLCAALLGIGMMRPRLCIAANRCESRLSRPSPGRSAQSN